MFFFPVGCLIFALFVLLFPILFILGYFHIVTVGFEKLGISPEATILILLVILIGSTINIPLTKRKLEYREESRWFGLFKIPKIKESGIFINLGGAVIPCLLSFYFLYNLWQKDFSLWPVIAATILMIVISKWIARVVPGQGIALPAFIPPLFATVFALIFAPNFAAPCAFISGVLGTLVGADLLNLKKIQKVSPGFLSIGGAGVFDGIFLIGIISALLSGL